MIALITGASSGIGRAMALNLASRGIDLILVARSYDKLIEVKREIRSFSSVRVKLITKDLSINEECIELHEEVSAVRVDILINNAGFGLFGKFDETDLNTELNMIDLNIKSLHTITKLFLPDFKKRDRGYILNVASIAGFLAGPYMSTYYATKNYVLQLTKAIHEELRLDGSNVYIGAFCPGPVDTNFNNVAQVSFSASQISAQEAADYAIEKMFSRKLVIVPTLPIKALSVVSRLVPTQMMLYCTSLVQKARLDSGKKK